jgi:Nucleoporin autopeptidase
VSSFAPRRGCQPADADCRAPSTGGERAESTHSGAADGTGQDSQPDPRRLFVRDPLPSTASASTSTAAPATGRPSRDDGDTRDQPAGGQSDGEPEIQASDSGRGQQQQQQPQRQKSQPDRQQREEGRGDGEERTEQPADRNGGASGRARSGNLQDDEVCGLPAALRMLSAHASTARLVQDACTVLQQTDQAVHAVSQISEMLPQLQPGSDYHVQPSLTQLAAMAREDPESLAHVANFTVGRPGIGSVHWLEEVDVRGVDVEGLVRLTKGGVEVQSCTAVAHLQPDQGLDCSRCTTQP